MRGHLAFLYDRLSEKLWLRPLLFCLLAILAAFGAAVADCFGFSTLVPRIERDLLDKLLSIIAASMLGVATFAVGSMVSAYGSVSSGATPRAFSLVIADDVSKTALSTFIAAFIFSVIALVAIKSDVYGRSGLFCLFTLTIVVLAWVVITFVRWVDQIARLGRIGTTIERIERAAEKAIDRRRRAPTLCAVPFVGDGDPGEPIAGDAIGYVQHIDVAALQACAEKHRLIVSVAALPGTFVGPGGAVAHIRGDAGLPPDLDRSVFAKAFLIGRERAFAEDPRFGLIALAEIAGRSLSPAINDPGTAIGIVGSFVRLFVLWTTPPERDKSDGRDPAPRFDRVRVRPLRLDDMFEDAFTAIVRDGAGSIELVVRLQKAFLSLLSIDDAELRSAVVLHSRLALQRAEKALGTPEEIETARMLAARVANEASRH